MSLERRLSQLENGKGEYQRLKQKYAFNVPVVKSPDGEILNPVHEEDKEEFERFLDMAERRGEIFNPTYEF